MIKRNFLIAGLLCVAMILLGSVMTQDAQASVMYKSERIKIVRPEAQKAQPAQKAEEAQKQVEAAKTEAAQAEKKPEESVAKSTPSPSATPSAAEAPSTPKVAVGMAPELLFGKSEHYYSRKDRIDPFAPFLHKPEAEAGTPGPKAIRRTPLTPLEKISLQQLKLTAILTMPEKNLALVQEPSGKGYILNKGTYIGEKGGRVSQILKDRVIVEEQYKDVFGKTAVRKIELKLKKAGE